MRFLAWSVLPVLLALLVGTTPGLACGQSIMIGALFALPLVLAGALLVSLPARTSLGAAAIGAAAAFVIRTGGAGLVLLAVQERSDLRTILATLTLCLLASLAIELTWWLMASRSLFAMTAKTGVDHV